MKNILVTGGLGYIGSHTVKELKRNNYNVIVIDNLSHGSEKLKIKGVHYYIADFSDINVLNEIHSKFKIDAILHLAAYIEVDKSMYFPERFFENNVCKSLKLVNFMIQKGIKYLVFSSSAAVYGNPKKVPVKENDETKPINPYGESKLMFEKMLEWFSKLKDIKFVALRYFNVAGCDPEYEIGPIAKETHLIPIAIKCAINNKEFHLFGNDYPTKDGTCIRDYIHVCDIANAHIKALEYLFNENKSEIFNVGYGHGYSVLEVIKTVEKVTNKKIKIIITNRRPGDPAEIVADNSKIKKILKWVPKYDNLNLIIKHTYEWEIKSKRL